MQQLQHHLDDVFTRPTILGALQAGRRLRKAARQTADSGAAAHVLLASCGEDADVLSQYLLIHALSHVEGPRADDAFVDMLSDDHAGLREHAAWALARRPPVAAALPGLARLVADGGFGAMLAQLTLEAWKSVASASLFHLREALVRTDDPEQQARLAETVELLDAPGGDIGRIHSAGARPTPGKGLRIAQVVLQGRLDPSLEGVGSGDSGGLATLLVSLGKALGERPGIAHAFTVARAFQGPGVPEVYSRLEEPLGRGASLVRVPFGPEGDLTVAEMWPHRVAVERGLERLLRRLGPLDGVHLRFADVGTLAAARVCRRLGIPIFFSLAPDPHSVIQAAERAGALSRRNFAKVDRREHFLFRAELVEWMLEHAARLALFPRPDLARDLDELLGIDVREPPDGRFWTVAEGIDPAVPCRAESEVRDASLGAPLSPVLVELSERLETLGPERRGLPLLMAVGRLHPVKGCHRLVEAWAGDPRLRERFNLLLVGGDLDLPSPVEARTLERIEQALERHPEGRRGVVLFGQRSNLDVARLLAAARHGLSPGVAPGGIYVCASDKEEFGLAILEAMAAGLVVVAPDGGGPATYVRDGEDGFLTATTSVKALSRAIRRAAAQRFDAQRAERVKRRIRRTFTVHSMAESLAGMYRLEDEEVDDRAA